MMQRLNTWSRKKLIAGGLVAAFCLSMGGLSDLHGKVPHLTGFELYGTNYFSLEEALASYRLRNVFE